MLGSWRAEGACGGGCLRGVEGSDSEFAGSNSAASELLASLLASPFKAAPAAPARGVAVEFCRVSGAFRAAGFSGEVSSIVTLHINMFK